MNRPVPRVDGVMSHHWIALATAEMSEVQAEGWGDLEGFATTSLELRISSVMCMRCGSPAEEAPGTCPGRSAELDHRWVSVMTLELDEQEVDAWLTGERMDLKRFPRSTNLLCTICGQPFAGADPACPERALYAGGDA